MSGGERLIWGNFVSLPSSFPNPDCLSIYCPHLLTATKISYVSDTSSFTKAAGTGDESAMDKLGWRKSNKGSTSSNDYSFFFGTADGKFKRIWDYVRFQGFWVVITIIALFKSRSCSTTQGDCNKLFK